MRCRPHRGAGAPARTARGRGGLVPLLLVAAVLAGCAGPDSDGPEGPTAAPDGPVAATPVEGCTVEEAGSGALRKVSSLVTFFEDHCGGDPPDVDLARETIVWHALGPRNTGGYAVELASAAKEGDALEVVFLEITPGETCVVTQVRTHPTGVWILDAAPETVELGHRAETRECEG